MYTKHTLSQVDGELCKRYGREAGETVAKAACDTTLVSNGNEEQGLGRPHITLGPWTDNRTVGTAHGPGTAVSLSALCTCSVCPESA